MRLIIDLDKIKDPSKREWLLNSLRLMQIGFHITEKPQIIDQYNNDLEKETQKLKLASSPQQKI